MIGCYSINWCMKYIQLMLLIVLYLIPGYSEAKVSFGFPNAVKSTVKKLKADSSTTNKGPIIPPGIPSGAKLWTFQYGGASDEAGATITLDSAGNMYVGGGTNGGLYGNTNFGGYDGLLIKLNSAGKRQWAVQIGTTSNDFVDGTVVNHSGDIYVCGTTYGDLDGNLGAGNTDIFVAKYSNAGVKQWVREFGTSGYDAGYAIAVDASGNVYVTGIAAGGLDGNITAGGFDMFLTKYSPSGVKQWTRQLGTAAAEIGVGIKVSVSGDIYVAGHTDGGFDGASSAGGWDGLLVKFNSSGVKQWSRQFGTAFDDFTSGLAIDSNGYLYVVGSTGGGLDGNFSAGGKDIFLIKYDASGTKIWSKQFGTSLDEFSSGIAVGAGNTVFLTGGTYGGLDGNANAGNQDMYLAKYNSAGALQWVKQLGTSLSDYGGGVAANSNGDVVVSGITAGGLDGNFNAGANDIFVSKYAQ